MMKTLTTLFMAAMLAGAQDKPAEQKSVPSEAEIISVKTLSGDSFDRLIKLLSVFGARYSGDSQLRTILVYAPKDVVAQMRRVVEQLDRPGSEAAVGQNIDMTLTLLRCSTKPSATPAALPPDIEPVARQLRAATQYKDIQFWDVIPMRLQEGKEASESLRMPGFAAAGQSVIANIRIRPDAVYRKGQERYVRFARLRMDFRIPVMTEQAHGDSALKSMSYSYLDASLDTSGDFREGQKTVLGKVSGITEEDAIFAVITLKVLD